MPKLRDASTSQWSAPGINGIGALRTIYLVNNAGVVTLDEAGPAGAIFVDAGSGVTTLAESGTAAAEMLAGADNVAKLVE